VFNSNIKDRDFVRTVEFVGRVEKRKLYENLDKKKEDERMDDGS